MTSGFSWFKHLQGDGRIAAVTGTATRVEVKARARLELNPSCLRSFAIPWDRCQKGIPTRSLSPITCNAEPRRLDGSGPQPHRIENNVKIIWY